MQVCSYCGRETSLPCEGNDHCPWLLDEDGFTANWEEKLEALRHLGEAEAAVSSEDDT